MSLNIDRSNNDPFYRYKMPRLVAKVEGKGNGIKTVIVNMTDVGKALNRPPTYPTKFFGCELGAQTQFDAKNDRYIVNGSHTDDRLQTLLDVFIKKFVLCPGCGNPETNLVVLTKRGNIEQRCIACGYVGGVDMRHKLTTFILKNPPDQDPNAQVTPSKGKKDKKEKGKKGEGRGSPEAKPNDEKSAQQKMAAMRETGKCMDLPKAEEDRDDEDWGDAFDDDAVKARMEELTDAAKGLAFTDDLDKSAEDRLNMVLEIVKIKKDMDEIHKPAVIKELLAEAERLEVKEKVPLILVEVLLNENVLTQLKKFRSLFCHFTHQNPKAQKALLGAVEILIAKEYPATLMAKTPKIIQQLYEQDIVDEEIILEWGQKPSKKYVSKEDSQQILKEADPFLKWLGEAEEESDEDEDEDDEIIYSNTQKVGEVKEPVKPAAPVTNGTSAPAAPPPAADEDDDIDIDDI